MYQAHASQGCPTTPRLCLYPALPIADTTVQCFSPPLCVPPLTRFHTKKHCPRKSLRKYAVVCKMNSLMTFSLEELTAKCSLRLPKGRSAWLRVALLYMKHCFQATTTGSCFSLGKGKGKERKREHKAIEWHENPWDFPSQIPTTTRANVCEGAPWW